MNFQLGLAMANIDTYLHILGGELLVILAIVLPYIENKLQKQIASSLFLLLLGLMLAHMTTHLLPNKIASFIYSSRPEFNAKKT